MSKPSPSPIGVRLRQLREVAGVPARELDRLADLTEGHSSLIETGVVQRVTADTIGRLARTLGSTTDWLISGEGKEPSERAVKAAIDAARSSYTKPAA